MVVQVKRIKQVKGGRGRPKARTHFSLTATDIGSIVRRARITLGLSQKEVGDTTGVSIQFINNIEHGRANLPVKHIKSFSLVLQLDEVEVSEAVVQWIIAKRGLGHTVEPLESAA